MGGTDRRDRPDARRPATLAVRGDGGNEGAAPDGRGGLLLTQSLCDEHRPISIRNIDETGKQVWELTGGSWVAGKRVRLEATISRGVVTKIERMDVADFRRSTFKMPPPPPPPGVPWPKDRGKTPDAAR